MIIWTSMRTGGTVLIHNLFKEYVVKNRLNKKAGELLGLRGDEYFKIWSSQFIREDGFSLDFVDAVADLDLTIKVYDRRMEPSFYHHFIKRTRHLKHVVLFRESSYDRLVSSWFRTRIAIHDKTKQIDWIDDSVFDTPMHTYSLIKMEKESRDHYSMAISSLNSFGVEYSQVSYEDIYVRKNRPKVLEIFPGIDQGLFEKSRYDYHKIYHKLGGQEELKKALADLPKFDLLPIS